MQPELYFDISSEEQGGSLYRTKDHNSPASFLYHYSTYDAYRDEAKVYKKQYPSFAAFWNNLTEDKEWFYLHPLYIHPEVRAFVQQQLQGVDWTVQGDYKWQESHKRQWKKVLTDPDSYYKPSL